MSVFVKQQGQKRDKVPAIKIPDYQLYTFLLR